ncbi:hypothetical protein Godav_021848, partial [Gossypium davidsonii]|nr:hypothetical protein [Gossypium davidsonii]
TSFKDIFFREDSTREKAHEKDDVKLQDGEVITKTIDGILSTCFSERVHSLVEKSRCLTEIVNLMGRRVQVNALLIVVDLEKPLILKIWIDGMLQQVEYKCLPKFDTCPIRDGNSDAHESNNKEVSLTLVVDRRVELKNFDDWMIVEAKRGAVDFVVRNPHEKIMGSCVTGLDLSSRDPCGLRSFENGGIDVFKTGVVLKNCKMKEKRLIACLYCLVS